MASGKTKGSSVDGLHLLLNKCARDFQSLFVDAAVPKIAVSSELLKNTELKLLLHGLRLNAAHTQEENQYVNDRRKLTAGTRLVRIVCKNLVDGTHAFQTYET